MSAPLPRLTNEQHQAKARRAFRSLASSVAAWLADREATQSTPRKTFVSARRDGIVVVAAGGDYGDRLAAWVANQGGRVQDDPRGPKSKDGK